MIICQQGIKALCQRDNLKVLQSQKQTQSRLHQWEAGDTRVHLPKISQDLIQSNLASTTFWGPGAAKVTIRSLPGLEENSKQKENRDELVNQTRVSNSVTNALDTFD